MKKRGRKRTTSDNRSRPRRIRTFLIMSCKCLLVLLPVLLAIVVATHAFNNPLHAQCTVNWEFGISCKNVSLALQEQIKKWTSADNCKGGGEKCLYTLVGVSDDTLNATHETPVKHYIDDIRFSFTPSSTSGCAVEGYSRSRVIYAVLDSGTNYCNMENLITGSKLDQAPGYSESTSDRVCTQYSSADCEKY